MLSACAQRFTPRFNFGSNTPRPIPIQPSQKTEWQRAVWNSDLPCSVKGFLQNLAVGWMDAEGGSCYPSEEQMMERLGCSRPALTRWIRIAVEAGFLECWRYGRGIRNRRYNYQATLPGEIGTNLSDPGPEMGNNLSDLEPCPKDNHDQREGDPALPPIGAHSDFAVQPEPDPPPKAPVIPIPSKTTLPDDWQLPDDYRAWASQQRPDLVDRLDAIASNFADYHASKGTRSASWIAEWRRWINRERALKPTQKATTAPQSDSRYPRPDAPEKPLSAAVKAALESGEERRLAMLRSCGIDPVTGLKTNPPPATAAPTTAILPDDTPLPAGHHESPEAYEARFQQHREYQLRRLQELMEARANREAGQ